MKKETTYLDYAATTPLDPRVLKVMLPFLKLDYGNPSSVHSVGQKAAEAVEKSRERLASFLNCSKEEIVFTGSATEANNLAIFGLVKKIQTLGFKSHIITSEIEHHAVIEPFKILEKQGIEVTYLSVDSEGRISFSDIEKAMKENTVLVSIMYANNEIGTIQPIKQIGELIKNNKKKLPSTDYQIPFFHTDAVQAVNYLDCDVNKLGVDLFTLSGHKIYGPKGVGALYIRKGTPMSPIIYGGGQESGLRSGTENVAGIVGLGEAVNQIKKQKSRLRQCHSTLRVSDHSIQRISDSMNSMSFGGRAKNKKIQRLRDKLIAGILKTIPGAKLNGSAKDRLPNNANFSFKGAEGEAMVIALDQKGIAVSTGSACSSKSLEPSHVLMALGLSEEEAHTSLRVTLGRGTKEQDIIKILKELPSIVKKLREISGSI